MAQECDAPFVYRAELLNIVDGDTMDFDIDLGFKVHQEDIRLRLKGVDTHEIHFVDDESEEYERGMEEYRWVQEWFEEGQEQWDGEQPFLVDTYKDDEKGLYGRYLADVIRRYDEQSLVEALLAEFDDIEYQ